MLRLARDGNVFEQIVKHGNDAGWEPPRESEPTNALPGSEEKIEVMAERLRRGETLLHPDDVKCYEEVDRKDLRVSFGGKA